MSKLVYGKMSGTAQVILALAAILLSVSFFAPLWHIGLWAPQYPEGLNLYIWSSKLGGDVGTVNILNHYVGMAAIKADDIPELKFFPIVFAVLIATGLAAAAFGRKLFSNIWIAGLMGFALWAFYDFYAWEHKFGTELSPDAPLKMEDMVYQPPLIGSKEFLNITATSWPSWAGIAMTVSILLAVIVFLLNYKHIDKKIN